MSSRKVSRAQPGKAETALIQRATQALDALANHQGLPDTIRQAAGSAVAFDDLTLQLRGVAGAIVNLEDLAAEAQELAASARGLLLDLMQESGAGVLMLSHHTVDVVEPKPKLTVTDSKRVPASVTVQGRVIELWTTPKPPEPKVNLDAIKLAQKADAKVDIPGVALTNGTPYLRISPIEKAPKTKKGAAA